MSDRRPGAVPRMARGRHAAGGRQGRNQLVEALRIVAAFGIVVFHAGGPAAELGYAGLVVFLFLSPYFAVGPNRGRPSPVAALGRALLLPFAAWYAVYLAANWAFGRPLFVSDQLPGVLLAGPSIHLWFLPFLFVVLALLGLVKDRVSVVSLFWFSCLVAALMLAGSTLWRPFALAAPVPIAQWLQALAAAFCGIAAGTGLRIKWPQRISGFALIALGYGSLLVWPVEGMTVPYGAGLAACSVAIVAGKRLSPRFSVQPLADCMLGVYLVHVLALAIAGLVFPGVTLGRVVAAFTMSLAGVWLARRFVPQSRLVLG